MASLSPHRAVRCTNAKSGCDDLAFAWNVLRHGLKGYQVTMHHVLIVNELLDSLVESDRPKFVPAYPICTAFRPYSWRYDFSVRGHKECANH